MFLGSQAPSGSLSARRCTVSFPNPKPPCFSKRKPKFVTLSPRKPPKLAATQVERGVQSSSTTKRSFTTSLIPSSPANDGDIFVGQGYVSLDERALQLEKPSSSSRVDKWSHVALLAAGDVLALLVFSAFGRFSHGFSLFDIDTLRAADPFVAGWLLCAYFLGGYGEDGRGMNGLIKSLIAASKSWASGISLGIIIRAAMIGHVPPSSFVLVTMRSTAMLILGWRTLLLKIFPMERRRTLMHFGRETCYEFF